MGAVLGRVRGSAAVLAAAAVGSAWLLLQRWRRGLCNSHPAAPMVEDEATKKLHEELQGMQLMALHGRAVAEGVPADILDAAMEEGDLPNMQLVALLLCRPRVAGRHEQQQSLREELAGLRVMALRQRALAAGRAPLLSRPLLFL